MSVEDNKALARRWHHEAWNSKNLAVADEIFAADFELHSAPSAPRGPEGPRQNISRMQAAFPDASVEVVEQIAEGNMVMTRIVGTGTHLGDFAGISPTGRRISVNAVSIWRISDGKAVEDWTFSDLHTIPDQLQS